MVISIAAIDLNGALGYKNQLLCHLPNDLKRFKSLTQGNVVIMGRKTFESLKKPLPNRHNIVVSRKNDFDNVEMARSIPEAIESSTKYCKQFIIGGAEIYKQALPMSDYLELTIIDNKFQNTDCYFPEISLKEWKLIKKEDFKKDEFHKYNFSFQTFEKI